VSRLNDLLRELKLKEPALARDLELEVAALADRRAFGLNFERHMPEAVELPGRKIRKGDKVRVLPPRGQTPEKADEDLWRVVGINRSERKVTLERLAASVRDPAGHATQNAEGSRENRTAEISDLIVVAEFRDPIYPGLASTGRVERGGDKPFHTVINAENFHALQLLLFTHRGKVDCIYIDPPYNTGAKDWKYNNDYVESDDLYRHSKWLAFMERRLILSKELLNPENSVLIVTIDEKEYLRLGLLLDQTFPDARVQMVSITISPRGTNRANEFSRVDEYAYFVMLGASVPGARDAGGTEQSEVRWQYLRRDNTGSERASGRPNQFYPIFVSTADGKIASVGAPIPRDASRQDTDAPDGCLAVFPVRADGTEMVWGLTGPALKQLVKEGFVRISPSSKNSNQPFTISYVTALAKNLANGTYSVAGTRADGSKIVVLPGGRASRASTVWRESSHDAGAYGTSLLGSLIPSRRFPFPKSLYAVEDCLRVAIGEKANAVVLDFFSGSGTTAHAVMRLNKQDNGRRQSISVTNNEVSGDEQAGLRDQRLRPGDDEWEKWGICEYITKPRLEATITGRSPNGEPVEGNYKFTDESPMADGFAENVEFFTLTYEAPLRVASNREFAKIAPLLWFRAGSRGRRIDDVSNGWDVADTYGVLIDLDLTKHFLNAVAASPDLSIAYIVTDEDRLFESVARELPDRVEPVRLYEGYLRNFEIESGRGSL